MKNFMMGRPIVVAGIAAALLGAGGQGAQAAVGAMSTEQFLNLLGVNTHADGNSGWDTNAANIGSHLAYIGVRLERDWPSSATEGTTFKSIQNNWNPLGRLWTSIGEDSPTNQANDLGYCKDVYNSYGSSLVYAMGGPNEEDDSYPQGQGATLSNSATLQGTLYSWAHSLNIPVSQMEFGAGWNSSNNYEGDYPPSDTGIGENYTPGLSDFGGAHTYISNTSARPVDVLNNLRWLANMTSPGENVAHTEFGDYFQSTNAIWGQYCVMGAFDSAAAGDAGYIVYGLQDSDTNGFYDSTDTTANPVATYYHTMTGLLASTSGTYAPGQTPTFLPAALGVSYSNNSTASHLLLQKPTGEYVIADWSEQLMNGSQTNTSDTITFGQTFASVKVYDVESGSTAIATSSNVSSYPLSMNPGDTYLLVLSNGTLPATPTGLAGVASGTQVSLYWTASTGATSYNVYRGTSAGGESSTPIATGVTTMSYIDPGLTSGTQYYYEVKAVNSTGTSSYSNEASATPSGYLIADGTYTVINEGYGSTISPASASSGAGIIQGSAGSLDTSWTITNLGANVVKIVNQTTGYCIGCVSTGSSKGLVAQSYTGSSTQQWLVSQPIPGWFLFTSQQSGGYVAGTYSGPGTQLLTQSVGNGTRQQWGIR